MALAPTEADMAAEKYRIERENQEHEAWRLFCVTEVKRLRVRFDEVLQQLKEYSKQAVDKEFPLVRGTALAASWEQVWATKASQEAIMWLGMELKRLGEASPYPNSYKPENTIVDPTAQGA